MTSSQAKSFVIDASIARSASDLGATHPLSSKCRDFLIAVRDDNYQVVMTQAIEEEWIKHQSRFSLTWIQEMTIRGKIKLVEIDNSIYDELWENMKNIFKGYSEQGVMFKDFHLIKAALSSDKIIVSLDEKVRKFFSKTAQSIDDLQEIIWINPAREEENATNWLKNGANYEVNRCLGK